ncbi:MAG: type II toxin-antitoxin system HicA family toxin [Rectinemataceae bacterium]
MDAFPKDAPKRKVVKALEALGFVIVREREHIATVRNNGDGTRTPLTMPNHPTIKGGSVLYHTWLYPWKTRPGP